MTVCIRTAHDITWAVMDLEDSMTEALRKADKLENYLNEHVENPSIDRILYELNAMNMDIKAASGINARLRKEINRAYKA